MIRTTLKNLREKYWVKRPKDWHAHTIGLYHVSSIGCNHQKMEPADHAGPCLRQTFYDYINPIPHSETTKGNLDQGRRMHKSVQKIYRVNYPHSIVEFPLAKSLNKQITITGSVDIVGFLDNNEVLVLDFKTSSEWTFPHDEDDKSPTHFDQVYLYGFILQNFVFGSCKKVKYLKVVYLNKHDEYTGEQIMEYNNDIGVEKFMDFVNRCKNFHEFLEKKELPPREPMKWCKYCRYGQRCRSNALTDDQIREYTEEEIEKLYTKETGKSPIWRGNQTKIYLTFRSKFKVKG